MAVRIRGKATARPKKSKTPPFEKWFAAGVEPRPNSNLCIRRAKPDAGSASKDFRLKVSQFAGREPGDLTAGGRPPSGARRRTIERGAAFCRRPGRSLASGEPAP